MNIIKRNAMLGVLAVMFCTMTIAQRLAQPAFKHAKDNISLQYQLDVALCASWQGHHQKICKVQALGKASSAMALLTEMYQPSDEAHYHTQVTMAEVVYALAIQRCEATPFKTQCLISAKAANTAAIDQAKFELKTANMRLQGRKVMAELAHTNIVTATIKHQLANQRLAYEYCEIADEAIEGKCIKEA